jgi:hypothetical protein
MKAREYAEKYNDVKTICYELDTELKTMLVTRKVGTSAGRINLLRETIDKADTIAKLKGWEKFYLLHLSERMPQMHGEFVNKDIKNKGTITAPDEQILEILLGLFVLQAAGRVLRNAIHSK